MKKVFLVLALTATSTLAQPAVQEWVRRYSGPGTRDNAAVGIAVDKAGSVYVTGYSSGTNSYSDWDYATIKYSSAGLPLWTNWYGEGAGWDQPAALALDDAGNVFVTGSSYGNGSGPHYATIAYSSEGVALWTNRYGISEDDVAQAIVVNTSGEVHVIGYAWVGNPPYSYATIKYSNSGVPLWTNLFTGPDTYPNAKSAIAAGPNGEVVVTGASRGRNSHSDYATIKYSGAGVALWTNYYNGPGDYADIPVGVALDSQGNVFVTGSCDGVGSYDFGTIAYSAAGVPLWTNRFGGPENGGDFAKAIAVNNHGEVFVTGSSPLSQGSPVHYVTLAYSGMGLPLWTNLYTGMRSGDDEPAAMALDDSGNVVVTGFSVGDGSDYATVKYSRSGVPLWTNRFDGPVEGADYPRAIAVDRTGNVFVTGLSVTNGATGDFATIKYAVVCSVPLEVQKVDNQVVLTWTNSAFRLQSAPAINGVFTDIPQATSPYTNSAMGTQQFFRLISD